MCIDNWIFNANGDSSAPHFLSVICWICKPQGHIFCLLQRAKPISIFQQRRHTFPLLLCLFWIAESKSKSCNRLKINQVLNPFGSDHLWLQQDILVPEIFSEPAIHPCTLTLKSDESWLKTKKEKDELLFCTLTRSINPSERVFGTSVRII